MTKFKAGDRVRVMRKHQTGDAYDGCWIADMDSTIGDTLEVYGTDSSGDVRLQVPGVGLLRYPAACLLHTEALTGHFQVGDEVYIARRADPKGIWNAGAMPATIGTFAKVVSVNDDAGHIRLSNNWHYAAADLDPAEWHRTPLATKDAKPKTAKTAEAPKAPMTVFKPGMMVRVMRKPPADLVWDNFWTPEMDAYVGRRFQVIEDDGGSGVALDCGHGALFRFPQSVLLPEDAFAGFFEVGDHVRVARKVSPSGWATKWYDKEMDATVGEFGVVTETSKYFGVKVGGWWYPAAALDLDTGLSDTFGVTCVDAFAGDGIVELKTTTADDPWKTVRAWSTDLYREAAKQIYRDCPQPITITLLDDVEESTKEHPMFNLQDKTYINGADVAGLSDDNLIDLIAKGEAEIKRLSEIKTESKAIAAKIEQIGAALVRMRDILDARQPKGAKPAA